jgi:hypothetical protein
MLSRRFWAMVGLGVLSVLTIPALAAPHLAKMVARRPAAVAKATPVKAKAPVNVKAKATTKPVEAKAAEKKVTPRAGVKAAAKGGAVKKTAKSATKAVTPKVAKPKVAKPLSKAGKNQSTARTLLH